MRTTLFCCILLFALCAECIAQTVMIGWDPPGTYVNGDPIPDQGAIGYKVYIGTASGNYTTNHDVGPAIQILNEACIVWFDGCIKRTHSITGLAPGATYYFAVTAYDTTSGKESAYSNEISMTMDADGTLPADVTYFTATSYSSGIRLSWTNPVDPDLWQVDLEYRVSNGGFVHLATLAAAPGMPQTYDHLNLQPGTYSYAIHTRDTSGNTTHTAYTESTVGAEPKPSSSGGGGGGCFIATAAYGSYLDPHVMVLRDFRDKYLLTNAPGRAFVAVYYYTAPPIADFISKHEWAREIVRTMLAIVILAIESPMTIVAAIAFIILSVFVSYKAATFLTKP